MAPLPPRLCRRGAPPLRSLLSLLLLLSLVAVAAAAAADDHQPPSDAVPASTVARAARALAEPWQEAFPRQWDRREGQLSAVSVAGGVPLLSSPHGRLLAHRSRLLSPSAAARGLSHLGPAHALRRFLHRAARGGRALRVGAVGGSVSWGSAVERGSEDWLSVVTHRLRDYYPRSRFELTNGCVPATPASFTSACLQNLVPSDVDLVFVEFAVNDSGAGERGEPPADERAASAVRYERLLRKLLRLPRRPAVVLVHLPAVGMAMGEGHPWRRAYNQTVEDAFAAVGAYYDAPSVSLRSAAWRLARQHTHRMNWTDFYDSPTGERYDFIHPLAPGHTAVADLVLHALGEVALGLALRPWSGELPPLEEDDQERGGEGGGDGADNRREGRERQASGSYGGGDDRAEALAPLPPPLHPRNRADANLACAHGAPLAAHVVSAEGFELIDEGKAPKQKVGYVAWEPGARLVLRVDTSAAAAASAGGGGGGTGGGGGGGGADGGGEPAGVAVQLAYLRSYKHMGQASVECLGGCTCGTVAAAQPSAPKEGGDNGGGGGGGDGSSDAPPPPPALVVDGHHDVWQTTVYLLPLSPSAAADCRIAITVLNSTRSPDKGHKFKVTGLMMTMPPKGSLAADEAAALLSAAAGEKGEHAALQYERWLGQVNAGEAPAAEEVLRRRRAEREAAEAAAKAGGGKEGEAEGAAATARAAAAAASKGGGAAEALELPRSGELEAQRRERQQASGGGGEP